jgi:integration host factor subunit alpha
VTRADLLDGIYRSCPTLSRAEARDLLEMFISEIAEDWIRGETVKLAAFGRFTVRSKTARNGRNPRTGASARISPRRVASFTPSPALLAAINRPKG